MDRRDKESRRHHKHLDLSKHEMPRRQFKSAKTVLREIEAELLRDGRFDIAREFHPEDYQMTIRVRKPQ